VPSAMAWTPREPSGVGRRRLTGVESALGLAPEPGQKSRAHNICVSAWYTGMLSRGRRVVYDFCRELGSLALMLALGGCLLQTGKPDISIHVPDHYIFATNDVGAALPSLDWWQGFGSTELTSLMQEAQTANLDVAVAIAQVLQADAQIRITGANLLPTINVNGSDTATRTSQQSSTSTIGSPYSRAYATSLSASYIVDFWGKNQAALKSTVETAEASRFNKEVVQLTALASVADTYFQVLEAQDRLRIARRNLTDATRILDLIKQQFAAGTSSDLNVAQQESLVEQVRANIPTYEQVRLQNVAALAVLVGRSPERSPCGAVHSPTSVRPRSALAFHRRSCSGARTYGKPSFSCVRRPTALNPPARRFFRPLSSPATWDIKAQP
jgi:hypothetical protein